MKEVKDENLNDLKTVEDSCPQRNACVGTTQQCPETSFEGTTSS